MAHPVVKKKLTQMLSVRKKTELANDSQVLESMASKGSPMARKVIKMSND